MLKPLILFAVLIVAVMTLNTRDTINVEAAFEPVIIPADIDAYLLEKETQFPDIIEDARKQIIWAGVKGQKTDYSVVYVHGFSATSHEIRPVPEKVANALGANLYYTRLTGHGRTAEAMMDASPDAWLQDVIEAVEIGARIGEKVIVLATSNGGAVSTYLLTNKAYAEKISGIVLTSPAYKLAPILTAVMDFPYVRYWGTLVAGEHRGFEGVNADHEKYWTNEYPTLSVLPMAAIQRAVRKAHFGQIKTPALFFVSDEDKVVKAKWVRNVAMEWGGDSQLEVRDLTDEDDPYKHVLSGDILSPNQTAETVDIIINWVSGL
jgi:alpha-beta hydrolase superfamily lysophospholipase